MPGGYGRTAGYKEQSFETMHRMYEAMKQADSAYDKDLKSASGLAGGDGEKTALL